MMLEYIYIFIFIKDQKNKLIIKLIIFTAAFVHIYQRWQY